MTIERKDPNLTIKKKVKTSMGKEPTAQTKFTADGKPNSDPGFMETETFKSTAHWNGDRLHVEGTSPSRHCKQGGDLAFRLTGKA
jgi:hypothetical protein